MCGYKVGIEKAFCTPGFFLKNIMHEMAGFMHFQALGKGFYDYFATHEGRHSSRGGGETPKAGIKMQGAVSPSFPPHSGGGRGGVFL